MTPTMPVPVMSPTGSTSSPMITWLARATRSTPRVLETKGKERDTRTLHSITFSWSSCGEGTGVRGVLGPQGSSWHPSLAQPHRRYLGDELQVEGPGDLQLLPDGVDDCLDALQRLGGDVLRGRHQGGIARMHPGVLHVLRDGDGHHHAVTGHRVHIDLLWVSTRSPPGKAPRKDPALEARQPPPGCRSPGQPWPPG